MAERLRYCIEYINPQCPTLQNGAMNIRHWRVETEREADRAILLILSFGGKILSTYRGSVTQGRVSDWEVHLELEDRFSQAWFNSVKREVGAHILSRDEGESATSYLERCLSPEMRRVWYEACAEIKAKIVEEDCCGAM